MTDPKREADLGDENLVVKRTKVANKDTEDVEGNEVLDVKVSERNGAVSTVLDNRNKGDFQQKLRSENMKNGLLPEGSTSSEDATSSSSEVQRQQVAKLYLIEADAAEDKGSRHSMEDAWVVLPNASLEYPGKLRCAHFAIYDGHGGWLAAEYAQKHLHANVLSAGLPHGYKSCQKGRP